MFCVYVFMTDITIRNIFIVAINFILWLCTVFYILYSVKCV